MNHCYKGAVRSGLRSWPVILEGRVYAGRRVWVRPLSLSRSDRVTPPASALGSAGKEKGPSIRALVVRLVMPVGGHGRVSCGILLLRVTAIFRSSHIFLSETSQNKPFQALSLTGPQRGGRGQPKRAQETYDWADACAGRARQATAAGTATRGSARGSPPAPTRILGALRSLRRF